MAGNPGSLRPSDGGSPETGFGASKTSEDRCQRFSCSSAGRRSSEPVQGSSQRRPPALEGLLVAGLVVRRTLLPATKPNANPLKGQGSDGGVMVDSLVPHLLVISLGPGRFQARLGSELVKGLTHKGRAGEAPMNPFTLAAPHGNGGRSGETLHIGSVLKALAIRSEE